MAVTILDAVTGQEALPSSVTISAGTNRKFYFAALDRDGADAGGAFNFTVGGVTRSNAVAAADTSHDVEVRLYEFDEAAIASMSGTSVVTSDTYGDYFFWWTVEGADQSAAFSPVTAAPTTASGSLSVARVADSMTFALGAYDNAQAFSSSANPSFSLTPVTGDSAYGYGQQTDTANTSDFTWAVPTALDTAFVVINVAPADVGPTITDIDGDESVYPGQSFVVTGTNFGAIQGTGTVDIDGVAQTVTAWSDTSITCTAVRGGNEYGTGKTLTVTTDAATTATLTVAQEAEPGTFAVTAASPNTTDPASLWSGLVDTATGDPVTVVDGDQAWVKTLLDGLAIDPTGAISANETGSFTVQFWRASEGVWGSDQTVSFTLPSEPGTPSFVRGLKKALTSTLKKSLRTDI